MNAVINYCTLDKQYIEYVVNSVIPIVDEIIIPVSTHWYDGTPEDIKAVKELADKYRQENVRVLLFDWEEGKPPRYWHNHARYVGYSNLKDSDDWIIWLDSDEVVDTNKFLDWIKRGSYKKFGTIKLANYWYFRDTIYQSKNYEDSVVMCQGIYLTQKHFYHNYPLEREMFYEPLPVNKERNVLGSDELPMIHHYSWARTKDQMLRKVRSWGHKDDKDWESLVEKEFEEPFSGTDFIHGYSYNTVEPYINLRLED